MINITPHHREPQRLHVHKNRYLSIKCISVMAIINALLLFYLITIADFGL